MGLAPCISLQQQYSLLNRELELDLVDVCCNEGVAVLPWSPLKGLQQSMLVVPQCRCLLIHIWVLFEELSIGALLNSPLHV